LKRYHQITIEKALNKNQIIIQQQLRQFYHQTKTNSKADKFNNKILEACLD
jgi:hypothetical protein